MKRIFVYLILSLILFSCSTETGRIVVPEETRSYYLGFTPFPYDFGSAEQNWIYDKIHTDADIISHHFDNGIPWQESLDGTDFHINIRNEWAYRKGSTPDGHQILLSVTPIDILRRTLAPYKAESEDMELPEPWSKYEFNHDNVKKAYLNYCERIIDFYQPDYFCFGIEVNLLLLNEPSKWQKYMELHRNTYKELKKKYPDLPVFVSVTGVDLLGEYTASDENNQQTALREIMEYSDMLGLSMHTFLSSILTYPLPVDLFKRILDLTNKPIGITETSYPADTLHLDSYNVKLEGSPEKQLDFFVKLMRDAEDYDVKFIINFLIRDYDYLWDKLSFNDDIFKVWMDTGFYDEDGNPRTIRQLWLDNLALKVE